MATTLDEPQAPEAQEARRRWDPELRIMNQMVGLLEEIEAPARARVVAWLRSRFENN